MIPKKLIINELLKLQSKGVIQPQVVAQIKDYYDISSKQDKNLAIIAFGILGSILIGSGTILLIAHNWDDLPRWIRTILSLAPLLASQILGAFVILKKYTSLTWRETSATLCFFAIGSSIALISQTYNIHGDFGQFILTWSLLSLPLIYLFDAITPALFYIVWLKIWTNHQLSNFNLPWLFWPLLIAIVPYGYSIYKRFPKSTRFAIFSWFMVLFVTFTMPSVYAASGFEYQQYNFSFFIPSGYALLFSLIYLLSRIPYYEYKKVISNPLMIISLIGIPVMLLLYTFNDPWESLSESLQLLSLIKFSNPYTLLILSIFAIKLIAIVYCIVFIIKLKKEIIDFFSLSFIPFIIGYALLLLFDEKQHAIVINKILFNAFIVLVSISVIVKGSKINSISLTNYGMAILSILILIRFLDSDISYIIRGTVFILIGIIFFIVNYLILRTRKNQI